MCLIAIVLNPQISLERTVIQTVLSPQIHEYGLSIRISFILLNSFTFFYVTLNRIETGGKGARHNV